MEHIANASPEAATDEPASHVTRAPALPACRVSGELAEALIEDALDAGQDSRPGRAQRADGWTPERIRAFLVALSQCGVVKDAAHAAGMSKQSAFALRNRAAGCGFDIAWRAALLLARKRIADEVVSRAFHGCVEVLVRDGKVWGERHRFDNRLTMAVLARLDEQARSHREEDETARLVAEEFDQFVDLVCDEGNAGAHRFVASRSALGWGAHKDEAILARAWNYDCFGVGLESDLADREPATDDE